MEEDELSRVWGGVALDQSPVYSSTGYEALQLGTRISRGVAVEIEKVRLSQSGDDLLGSGEGAEERFYFFVCVEVLLEKLVRQDHAVH